MIVTIGIDYSLSSPAITVHKSFYGDPWDLKNCKFHFLTSKKKYVIHNGTYYSQLHQDYQNNEERFDQISDWAMNIVVNAYHTDNQMHIYMEDYAYAATGQVFKIAENAGALKHKLWRNGHQFNLVAPTTVKKFGSGKGNSGKYGMHEAFLKETGIDVSKVVICNPGDSPAADIIDAYYIAKYGFVQATEKAQ